MDLKIKDVSELLSVSEATVRRWLANGQIPAYRLNHQYRFSRLEIEEWMMSCKLNQEKKFEIVPEDEVSESPMTKTGTQQFSLFRAIHKGDVLSNVPGNSKEELIRNVAKLASQGLGIDADLISELLLDREKLASTALNHGIAVPHPREFVLKGQSDRVVVVFPENPVDFEAMDGKPVHTLFFLFSTQDKRHLHLLSKIAHLSSRAEAVELLQSKPEKDSLLAFIKSWENEIGR